MTTKPRIRVTDISLWASSTFSGFRARVEHAGIDTNTEFHIPGHLVGDVVPGNETEILAIALDNENRSEVVCRLTLAQALARHHGVDVDPGPVCGCTAIVSRLGNCGIDTFDMAISR